MSALPLLKIAYDPLYAHPLPEGHRFPMVKYELIPGQLLYEGTIRPENLFRPEPCPEEVLGWTHTENYLRRLRELSLTPQEQRRIGFPQTAELVRREKVIIQGTIDCCHHALDLGVSLNVAGGTHHAYADRGEGFCLLNDFAVAANYLLRRGLAQRILIIDLDVHQGNGSASLFAAEPRVFTFSMHGRSNYPFHKEQSDLDVPLEDGTGDSGYLDLLARHLPPILDRFRPDFAFYLSGVDILETDRFGKLKVTLGGCRQRDELVLEALHDRGIPCTIAMGGGYSPDIRIITEAHCQTFRCAKSLYGLY
ncbi:MAG TPA: histone deacetylase [Chitinophagaceae bacterium]|nr:histone deacetylase [Chitinophagaceae bacterium]